VGAGALSITAAHIRPVGRGSLRARSTRFIFNDPAVALRRPDAEDLASDECWRLGISPVAIAAVCDEMQVLGYRTDAAMVARDVDGYLKKTGSAVPLRVAIRPMFPDCESTENLTGKLRLLGRPEVTAFDFYAYDFMRLEELDRVRDADAAAD
jgi:hypothetical protein